MREMPYKVEVGRLALASMLMNGLEAFLLPMKNRNKKGNSEAAKGHEIFGYIFGTRHVDPVARRCTYKVEFINFDATARTSPDSVEYEPDAQNIKSAILSLVAPKMQLLGTIHTHPYRLLKTEEKTYSGEVGSYMYTPSGADEDASGAMEYQLDLILTVVNTRRKLTHGTCYAEKNCKFCLRFDLDNIRFFLGAYVRGQGPDFRYVPYADVHLKQPAGLGIKARELDIPDELKERHMKI
ncbi:MAG: hypothetical protein HDQ94_00370 [Desulfovibrio sp.]|nr:hypothetical protein [Desulfovibrio sp.]